ncbi:MAG: sigma-70 family RNA polymerase sigma factor [Tuberibacillus sp.]
MKIFEESRRIRKEFETWIQDYRKPLWDYCLRLTKNVWDAEDLFQETLLKSFSKLNYLYEAVSPKSYLFRIATNHWLSSVQKQKRTVPTEKELFERIPSADQHDPVDLYDGFERMSERLTHQQQSALILTKGFGFTNKEAAEFLSLTEGAVKSLLKRAKDNLKQDSKTKIHNMETATPLMNAYLEAFNQKDPDGIAALLSHSATMDIVGVSHEFGKEAIRKSSLHDWSQDPVTAIGSWANIDGEAALLAWTPENQLYTVIRMETSEDQIVSIHEYYFSRELLEYIAALYNKEASQNGTFWDEKWKSNV